MRRRGYDVTAKPLMSWNDYVAPEKAFIGTQVKGVIGQDHLIEELKQYEDGARFTIIVKWKNSPHSHAFIAEVSKGKVFFRDPQPNKPMVADYFERATRNIQYFRMDNLEPSDEVGRYMKVI
jgi:hypothetical protein